MSAEQVGYSEDLDPGIQVDTEERIAALIFNNPSVECSDGEAGDLGREILYLVLREFRPDLFDDAPAPVNPARWAELAQEADAHADVLQGLIDGVEDDDLGELLGPTRDFLRSLGTQPDAPKSAIARAWAEERGIPVVNAPVSSEEIGPPGEPQSEYGFAVRFSVQVGADIQEPRKALEEALLKTLNQCLWLNLPGTRSTPPEGRILVYTTHVTPL